MAVNRVAFKDPTLDRKLEGETFTLDMTFLDSGTPTDPGTFYYRVDSLTDGTTVTDWTTVPTSDPQHALVVVPAKLNSERRAEDRRQLVVAGPDKTIIGRYEWIVENLVGYNVGDVIP